ncbi:hypothetical protein D3C87_1723120 [compost metagenome]
MIARGRAENKDVIARATPQEGHTLMAGIDRLHHRRSLPNLRLPERISTPTGSNRFRQPLQRRAFGLEHLRACERRGLFHPPRKAPRLALFPM